MISYGQSQTVKGKVLDNEGLEVLGGSVMIKGVPGGGTVTDLQGNYEIKVNEEHEVYIQMTLTAPNCPMADYVMEQVRTAVEDVPGVVSVKIDLVFEPVWDRSRMSEEALVELGLDLD